MSSPRPVAPSSSTPAISVRKRMQRVQWMQRFMLGLDQRAEILVADGALVLLEPAAVETVGHRLVLQIALAALVADRAIERMIDQQELHHPLLRLDRLWRFGVNHHAVGRRHRAGGDRLWRFLDLDQTHPAVAGDREALVVAEMRDLDPGVLAGLQDRRARPAPRPPARRSSASASSGRPPFPRGGVGGIRRCAAPSPGGNGGSALAPATSRRRPARRSCDPRSRRRRRAACRSPRPRRCPRPCAP